MKSADFNEFQVYDAEEFGGGMTMNGEDQQLGFDFGAIISGATDTLYEAQKKLLGTQQKKLEAQAIKTTGEFVGEQAQKILAAPSVKSLIKEQAEEAAVQKVARTVREGYQAVMKTPGKYGLYVAGSALLLAFIIWKMRK